MGLEIKQLTPVLRFTDDDVNEVLKWYGRNLETAQKDIEDVKMWIKTQKHLAEMPSDRQIFSFLLQNKFFVEGAKQKIDMFYTIRGLIPDLFQGQVPSAEQVIKMNHALCIVPLPILTENRNRIIVSKACFPNEPTFSSLNLFKLLLMLQEMRSLVGFANSEEHIIDMSKSSSNMSTKYNVTDVKNYMNVIEKVYSNRLAALHVIGLPSYWQVLVTSFKTFAEEKIRNIMHLHESLEDVQKLYPKSVLPKDFGGDLPSTEELRVDYLKLLEENEDYFQSMQKVKVNESLRQKKLDIDDILGYHGNFKNLSVD